MPQGDSVSHSLAVLSTVYHYNHWIFDAIRLFLGRRIVEVGSGVGNITQFMLNADEIICLEPFQPYFDFLVQRFQKHLNVSVHQLAIEQTPCDQVPAGCCDSVVCLNVLEHIQDDVDALRRMKSLAAPGGNIIVFVPALPYLYGAMDKAMGHVRRYTLGSLRSAFRQAGIRPVQGRYFNVVGALGWWWNGWVLKHDTIPVSATRHFDRIVPIISAIERIVPVLLGQSVMVVGKA
jgi:SAM-dependent methyltransferase